MSFFKYIAGFAFGPGVGTEGLGLVKPQTDPLYAPYDYRHTVRGNLDVQRPGFMKINQQFQPVSITGNGNLLQGQLELQKLAQLQGAANA